MHTWNRVAKILRVSPFTLHLTVVNASTHQEYEGKLSFTTDTWTSPNHRALIAFSVHFTVVGKPRSITLDVVEVAKVRLV